MIKKCKYCGSEKIYLKATKQGYDIASANGVAVKCEECNRWLAWASKSDVKEYLEKTNSLSSESPNADTTQMRACESHNENKSPSEQDLYLNQSEVKQFVMEQIQVAKECCVMERPKVLTILNNIFNYICRNGVDKENIE